MCASGDGAYCVLTAALLQWVLRGAVREAAQNRQPRWGSKVRITLVFLIPLLQEYAS